MSLEIQPDYVIGYTGVEFNNIDYAPLMTSPMDQFEIKPFLVNF